MIIWSWAAAGGAIVFWVAPKWGPDWALLLFPTLIIVGTLGATLRCPKCLEWVMLSTVPLLPIRRRPPKVCQACGWSTKRGREEGTEQTPKIA